MSASACIIFYGLRFEIPSHSVEDLLEEKEDERIEAGKRASLDVYWANFGGVAECYLLFIGKKIGVFGPEDHQELRMTPEELERVFSLTNDKLTSVDLLGSPALFVQWEEDN